MNIRSSGLAALMGLLGAVVLLLHQSANGIVLIWDSAAYAHTAQTLLRGEGFMGLDYAPLVAWPPGYSLLLAIATLGVFDPVTVMGPLNVALFALTLFILAAFLNQRLRNKAVAIWASLCALLAWPFAWAAASGLSETAFVLFATAALARADEYRRGAKRAFWWSAAFAALACLTRYMGVAVLVAIALLIVVQGPAKGVWERVRAAATYVAVAAAPVGVWLVRNMLVGDSATGKRDGGEHYGFHAIVDAVAACFEDWLTGDFLVADSPSGAATATLALCCGAVVGLTVGTALCLRSRRPVGDVWDRPAIALFGLFVLVYLGLLFAALLARTTWSGVQARYSLPIYLPLLILIAFAVDGALEAHKRRAHNTRFTAQALPLAIAGCLGAALVWQLDRNMALLHGGSYLGYGRFNASATLRDARSRALAGTLFTNDAAATFLHMPSRPLLNSRRRLRHRYLCLSRYANRRSLILATARGDVHVLWLHGAGTSWYPKGSLALADVLHMVGLEPVAELPDGLLWRFNPISPAVPALAFRRPRGEPIRSAKFELFLERNVVVYVKQPCTDADTEARFFAHLVPNEDDGLAAQSNVRFVNLDFDFKERGLLRKDGACVARLALPDYAQATLRTGQFAGEVLWETTIELPAPASGGTPPILHGALSSTSPPAAASPLLRTL